MNTISWRNAATVVAGAAMMVSAQAGMLIGKEGPNLVTNPGFESGLAGWSTIGFLGQGFDYGIDSTAHSGTRAFYGGTIGLPLGFLSQTIATTPGAFYRVSYWLESSGFFENEFVVRVDGQNIFDRQNVPVAGATAQYVPGTVGFFATAATTQLSFGFRDDSFYFHLDDVSVTIPEPGSVALLSLGLAAAGWIRRKPRA